MMEVLSETFPCAMCRQNMKEYMRQHPFFPYWDMMENGRAIGMFKWSWTFHNFKNSQLGKPIMSWETALNMYYRVGGGNAKKGGFYGSSSELGSERSEVYYEGSENHTEQSDGHCDQCTYQGYSTESQTSIKPSYTYQMAPLWLSPSSSSK